MRPVVAAILLAAAAEPSKCIAQSTHLAALEGSAPSIATEPLTGGFDVGLAGIFQDPTSAAKVTGALFGVFHSTYSSVELYHLIVAFRAGPRWSLHYAATEIKDLFDTTLTNADPGLESLRARAMLVGVDGTLTVWDAVAISAGLSSADDENVGERRMSTLARFHVRVSFAKMNGGLHWTKATGPLGDSMGQISLDLGIRHRLGQVESGLQIAVHEGALWRYSEIREGVSVGGFVAADSTIKLRIGVGQYTTGFGVARQEWRASVSVGVTLGDVHLGASYTGTRLGLGTGYGISLGYEPR